MADQDLIAWAAGLFEGEGSITIYNRLGGKSVMMCLAMSDEDVVRRFFSIVGCGKVYFRAPREKQNKPQWRWQIAAAREVERVLHSFRPYFGKRRLQKADEALAFAKLIGPRGHGL